MNTAPFISFMAFKIDKIFFFFLKALFLLASGIAVFVLYLRMAWQTRETVTQVFCFFNYLGLLPELEEDI